MFNPDYIPTGKNNRINLYYMKINHVRIAKNACNKREFLLSPAAEPPPPLEPEGPPATPWTTHAAAEAWLDQFTERTGIGTPLDWSGSATLSQKHTAALQLWDDYIN